MSGVGKSTARDSIPVQGDVAIVGMACLFPGASTLAKYWENIVHNRCLIGDPPVEWQQERYHNPDQPGNHVTYSKKGGYLGTSATFDPLAFGVMPSSLDGGEPDHFLALKVAREALYDAGLSEGTIDSERTEVIVGRGTYINRGVANSFQHTVGVEQTVDIIRQCLPDISAETIEELRGNLKRSLPPFTAETVQTLVPNILTGRIANRLNIMGPNYLVDAACASSLIAVQHGLRDLLAGTCDLALIGGVNASIPPTMLVIFSQIEALSRKEVILPFDEAADGTLLSEGLGFIVMKRKDDAVRDNDRIYACIKGIGTSSDGRGAGLLAPRVEGESLAIRRAYEFSGIAPDSIGLVEAHGTGTAIGDVTEIEALRTVFGSTARGNGQNCALGTVKSQIGHLIPASGIASIIKTALALHHKVLPPTICHKPNPKLKLENSPFYINSEVRPWIHGDAVNPRRAGINAFGFGGINAHAVLEESVSTSEATRVSLQTVWDDEVFLFQGETRVLLTQELLQVHSYLDQHSDSTLKDLAFTLNSRSGSSSFRLSIIAGSVEELSQKIISAIKRLEDPSCHRIHTKNGIYFFAEPLGVQGKVAFLFPGEGSQYANMLADLCMQFPEVRTLFDRADQAFFHHQRGYLPSQTIFPLPLGQSAGKERFWNMDIAAESVFTASVSLLEIMKHLRIEPDVLLGHSTGEYSAIIGSGMIEVGTTEGFIQFVTGVNAVYEKLALNRQIAEGVLLSVGAADEEYLLELLEDRKESLHLAMDNCPQQKILCGAEDVIGEVEQLLRKRGAIVERLPFERAYHTPLFQPICGELYNFFRKLEVRPPVIKMYSCASAAPFPEDIEGICRLATSQWARRVRFTETIRRLHEEGVRLFVEVGPGGKLTSFVDNILRNMPHQGIASNLARRSGTSQINHLVGILSAHHVALSTDLLYRHRQPRRLSVPGQDVTTETARRAGESREVRINLTLPRMQLDGFSLPVEMTQPPRHAKGPAVSDSSAKPKVNRQKSSQLFQEYISNMEYFLNCQSEIVTAYCQSRNRKPARTMSTGAGQETGDLPFITKIISLVSGVSLECRCHLKPDRERFLLDHVLGKDVSAIDRSITALPILPLTFSMEILAQAASLLMPGKKLTGMKEVRGTRWIGLDRGATDLVIKGKVISAREGEVKVEIYDGQGGGRSATPALPAVEGTIMFSDSLPASPPAAPHELENHRKSKWSTASLYDGFMFHGPTLQGVSKMLSCGSNGASAELRNIAAEKLFHSAAVPRLLAEPVVLDAAGQVIAYWTSEYLENAFHIFPFRLEALQIFGPPLRDEETVACRADIQLVDEMLIRSDIELVDAANTVRIRLNGWWDRRFSQPDEFYELRLDPLQKMLSKPWIDAENAVGGKYVIRVIRGLETEFFLAHDQIWMRVLANLVLSRTERTYWYAMEGSDSRRLEWLLGRVAAKDAVRVFLKQNSDVMVYPADIELGTDVGSRPDILMINGNREQVDIDISISHSGKVVAACAGKRKIGLSPGIDIETERDLADDFSSLAFSAGELELLPGQSATARNEWLLRFWCAGEAVTKARGRESRNTVVNFNRESGTVDVLIDPEGQDRTFFEHSPVKVKTLKSDGLIVAIV